MHLGNRHTSVIKMVWVVAAAAAVTLIAHANFGTISPTALSAAPPQKRSAHVSDEDHSRKEASLRKVMNGPVDVFFDVAQVEAKEPMLEGVRFVDLVDVTGKELMRFESGTKEQWLIDPDTILTFRITPTVQKASDGRK